MSFGSGPRLLLLHSDAQNLDAIEIPLFGTGQTTGTSEAIPVQNALWVSLTVQWASGTTAGVIVLESARDKNYSGTWSQEDQSTADPGGAAKADRIVSQGPMRWVRARFSTNASGGGAPDATAYLSAVGVD